MKRTFYLLLIAIITSIIFSTDVSAQTRIGDHFIGEVQNGRPTARHECSYVQAGDKFYLMGGRETNDVEEYDYTSQHWITKKKAPIKMHHFQAIEHGGLIWAICGLSGEYGDENSEPPLESVYIYDPLQDKWIVGPEIPANRRRGSAGVVQHNGAFYILGGNTNGHFGGGQLWTDKWDPSTNTWTSLADGLRKRDHFHAVIKGDKIYTVGGRHTAGSDTDKDAVFRNTHDEVDVYDISTNSWSTPSVSGFVGRAAPMTGIIGNKIFVLGGEHVDENKNTLEKVQAFDLATNSWENLPNLPGNKARGRHGTQGAISNGVLWSVAGSSERGGKPIDKHFGYFPEVKNAKNRPTGDYLTRGEFTTNAAFLSFDNRNNNQTNTLTLKHSSGNQGILISDITLSGTGFSFANDYNFPLFLAPGKSLDLVVNYSLTANPTDGLITIKTSVPATKDYNFGLFINTAAAGTQPIIRSGYYTIKGLNNSLIVSSENNNVLTSKDNSAISQWFFDYLGNNEYSIKNKKSNQFLSVPSEACGNGKNIATQSSLIGDHQKWIISRHQGRNRYFLRPKHCNNFVLHREVNTRKNVKLKRKSFGKESKQTFRLQQVGGIIEDGIQNIVGSNKQFLSVPNNLVDDVFMASTGSKNKSNQWDFKHLGKNEYTIKNMSNGKFLEVPNGGCQDGTAVATSGAVVADHRKWIVSTASKGRYFLRPKHCLSQYLNKNNGDNKKVHTHKAINTQEDNIDNRSFYINPVKGIIEEGTYAIGGSNEKLVGSPNNANNNVKMVATNARNATNQWLFDYVGGNNEYTIKNIETGRFLKVIDGQCGNGKNVATSELSDVNTKIWIISRSSNDRYFLTPKNCPEKHLHENADAQENVTIRESRSENVENQSFYLNPETLFLNQGTWGPVLPSNNVVAVAAANLPDGRILAWSGRGKIQFEGPLDKGVGGKTYTTIFNPEDESFSTTEVKETGHDMFCPGISTTGAGEIVISGGASSEKTTIYNIDKETWTVGPTMQTPRGYHSTTILSDGRIFAIGGSWSGGNINRKAEVYSPTTGWYHLDNVTTDNTIKQGTIPEGDRSVNNGRDPETLAYYRPDNHAWLFAAPHGKVFQAGPGTEMHWIETSGQGSVSNAGKRSDDDYAMCGVSVMYDKGKILTFGGSTSYSDRTAASRRSYAIDINNENNVTVTKMGNMSQARTLGNGVVLPNGEVVAIGGAATAIIFNDKTASMGIDIWSPKTEKWRKGPSIAIPRTYHSVAILMKDGRIFSGGGGYSGETNADANHPDAQIYRPSYLYNEDGSLATRPTITAKLKEVNYNSSLTVTTNDEIKSMVLIRQSSVTHSTNTDQRRIPVRFTAAGSNEYTVKIPNNDWAPPGYYFLFALNSNGTPSVGESILIGGEIASEQLILNGDHHIESFSTKQLLSDLPENNNNVRMRNKSQSKSNQTWNFVHLGDNVYTIQNVGSGKFLEIPFVNGGSSANVSTYTTEGNDLQKWIVSYDKGSYFFQPVNYTSAALDGSGILNGNVKATSFSTGNNNQKFNIIKADQNNDGNSIVNGTFYIQNKSNGQNILEDNSAGLIMADPASTNNHQWEIAHMGDGRHSIRNIATNSVLLSKNDCENSDLTAVPLINSNNQRYYYLKKIGAAYFLIPEFCQNKAIDKTKKNSDTPRLLALDISNDNQQWNLIPIDVKDAATHNDELQATPILGNQTELRWIVSQSDEEVLEYTIERTSTLFDFDMTTLTTVIANSETGIIDYQFIDEQPEIGDNYYRIKIKYKNGNSAYIPYKVVSFDPLPGNIGISPNPTSDFLNIDLSKYMDETIYIMISSMNGNVLLNETISEGHSAIETINVSQYAGGTYIIHVRPKKHREMVKRLIINRN